MKKQKLREFIREFVEETMNEYALLFEASRSVVKKGKKDIEKEKEEEEEETEGEKQQKALLKKYGDYDKEETEKAIFKDVDKEDLDKYKKLNKFLKTQKASDKKDPNEFDKDYGGEGGGEEGEEVKPGEKGTKPGSEEKTKDALGRNITKYTAVSKKGRETPMIQYDDPTPISNTDKAIKIDWDAVHIEGYHYDNKETDVYVYDRFIAITYRKGDKTYIFNPAAFKEEDKSKEDEEMNVVNFTRITNSADWDKEGGDESSVDKGYIEISPQNQTLIHNKWSQRNKGKTKTGRSKDDKALFKGGSDKEGYIDMEKVWGAVKGAQKGGAFTGGGKERFKK